MIDTRVTVVMYKRFGMRGSEQRHQRDDGTTNQLVAMIFVFDDRVAHFLEAILDERTRATQ
jgi:hypothetical protein